MENVLDENDMLKLKSAENKLFVSMQRQLMDMTNFKDGTILDNIILTNERLTDQLKLKIDLRTPTCIGEEDQQIQKDKVKQLEDKLDGYIIDFVNLNARYKNVLKEKFDDLQTIHNHNLKVLEAKLNEHIKSLDGSKHQDSEMKS